MARKVTLSVNGNSIKLDYFVESYIYHIASGIIASLKDTGPIKKLAIVVEETGKVKILLNGNDIPLNAFATEIVRNTLGGMISVLKGVEGKLRDLSLNIEQ